MKRSSILVLPFSIGLVILISACALGSVGLQATPTNTLPFNEAPIPTQDATEPTPGGDQIQDEAASEYWRIVEDSRTGVRFAVPCFWRVDIPGPEQDPSGLGAFQAYNYPSEFADQFPRGQGVFESGGIKLDLLYFTPSTWNLEADTDLVDLALVMIGGEMSDFEVAETQEQRINGQDALFVKSQRKGAPEDWGVVYLFSLGHDLVFGFAPAPVTAIDHPDVQAILNSITLSSDGQVAVPVERIPAAPPEGVPAACMPPGQDNDAAQGSLDCSTVDVSSVLWVACNIQDALRSRNLQPMIGYMSDPFRVGYWGSEGQTFSPEEMILELDRNRLPSDTSRMAFTAERVQFPSLEGMPPEGIFGPELNPVLIVFSQGWGQDGRGEALLYFTQSPDGTFEFSGIVLSQGPFGG